MRLQHSPSAAAVVVAAVLAFCLSYLALAVRIRLSSFFFAFFVTAFPAASCVGMP